MFQTVTARCAIPYLLFSHDIPDELEISLPSQWTLHMPFEILNDLLGIEGLLSEMGRTGFLAPTAPGAGVELQEVFPGKLFNPSDTVALRCVEIDLAQGSFGLHISEENVKRGGEEVKEPSKEDIRKKGQAEEKMEPPENRKTDSEMIGMSNPSYEDRSQCGSHRRPWRPRRLVEVIPNSSH
jgi:hypothetical protein